MGRKQKKLSKQIRRNWTYVTMFTFAAIIISIAASVFLVIGAIQEGAETAYGAFKESEKQVENDVYNEFYERSRQAAERNYHVSHRTTIILGDIQETAALQVLSVSAVGYSIQEQADNHTATAWLRVLGSGTFTVNLKAGEFLVDNERQYVLVRIPKPDLTSFSRDSVEQLLYEDGSWGPFNGDSSSGTDLAKNQVQEALLDAKESITSNQRFYKSAETSAKVMIQNLVKSLNPNAEQLIVDVEFTE